MIAALLLVVVGLLIGAMLGGLFVAMNSAGAADDAYRAGYRAARVSTAYEHTVTFPKASAQRIVRELEREARKAAQR